MTHKERLAEIEEIIKLYCTPYDQTIDSGNLFYALDYCYKKMLVLTEALEELVDIVQGHLDGEDTLDSFTLQIARKALEEDK